MPLKLTLAFDGRTVELESDTEGRFNLNAIYKVSGAARAKQVSNWTRLEEVIVLVEKYSKSSDVRIKNVLVSTRGRQGGTWVIPELVFAFAEWISPDFHKTVLDTFAAAANGDGEKAVKKAQTVARIEGIPFRKQYTSAVSLSTYGGGQVAYRLATNKVYIGLFNKNTDSLRADFNLTGRKTPRDHMGDDALGAIQAVEALSAIAMRQNHESGERRWERVVDHVLDNVRSALGLSPSKFLDATK